jgi:hypothetical protein
MRKVLYCVLMFILNQQSYAAESYATESCDRLCLLDIFDRYVESLVQHNPAMLPLASEIQVIENFTAIVPGAGLWQNVSAGSSTFRIVVADSVSQSVGGIVMMMEKAGPIEVAIRLKIDRGKIIRADHLVARGIAADNLKNLQTPRAVFSTSVTDNERMSRSSLLEVAANYYEAVAQANGRLAPFAEDCVRHESGWQSTNAALPAVPPKTESGKPLHRDQAFLILATYGCAKQLDTKIFANISEISDRRIDIADPETGLVFAFSHFHHEFKQQIFNLVGVPGIEAVDWDLDPFDLYAAHIFKISGGKIHEIEANGVAAPFNSPTVW